LREAPTFGTWLQNLILLAGILGAVAILVVGRVVAVRTPIPSEDDQDGRPGRDISMPPHLRRVTTILVVVLMGSAVFLGMFVSANRHNLGPG